MDIDAQRKTMNITPTKGSNPRILPISDKLLSMLNKLPKTNDYIFSNSNLSSHRWRFAQQKKKLAEKLQNPRLKQIKFHTLRHFKASQEYAKTRDLIHVKQLLGHRNINSTLVYTHLVPFDEDAEGYHHARARDDKEAGELIDQGFQYVCTTPQKIMMFRKRK